MKEKELSVGQLLAKQRWANRTKKEIADHMAKMRAAKAAKTKQGGKNGTQELSSGQR